MATEVLYLGWHGRGNFGDDALFDFWQRGLPEHSFLTSPLYRRDLVSAPGSTMKVLRRRMQFGFGLVGGGTVLGYDTWHRHVNWMRRLLPRGAPIIALGAGAANDLDTEKSEQRPAWEAWRSGPKVEVLGVRGPLSAAAVEANLGTPVEVTGDPAMFYDGQVPCRADKRGVIVSIADVAGLAADRSQLRIALAGALARVFGDEPITIFALAREDVPESFALAGEIRRNRSVRVVEYGNVQEAYELIGEHRVIVSERLHGCVAGAAVGTIPVAVGYKLKHLDFMQSVGIDELHLSREEADAESLLGCLLRATSDEVYEKLSTRLQTLRQRTWEALEPWRSTN